MMFFGPFRKLRNIFAALRGGAHPAEIAAGVCLGLFLGLTPLGLHLILPVLALLVFRCSTGLAFFSMALSKGLYLMLSGVFYHTGFYLLHDTQLFDGLIQTVMQLPIIGFMGFDRYLLFGSYVVCLCVSLVLFPLTYFLVLQFRHQFLEWITRPGWMQSFIDSTAGSWIIWLCFGNPGDREVEPGSKPGIGWWFGFLRLKVIGGLAGLTVLVLVVAFIGYGLTFTALTSTALSRSTGVEVRVQRAAFSPFNGRLTIEGIFGEDPDREQEDLFQVDKVAVDLNMYRVLAGKLHLSEIALDKLRLNVRRREDGSLNVPAPEPSEEKAPTDKPEEEQTYREWLAEQGRSVDWIQLIRKYGQTIREQRPGTTDRPEPDEKREPPEREPREPGIVYRDGKRVVVFDANATYPYEDRIPWVKINEIAVRDAELGLKDETTAPEEPNLPSLTNVSGNIEHLSSNPALLEDAITADIAGRFDGKKNATLALESSYHPEKQQSLNLALAGLNLVRLRPIYEQTLPVALKNGTLSTRLTAHVEQNIIDVPTSLSLRDLVLQKKSNDQQLFGMEPDTSTYIIRGINAYAEQEPVAFDFLIDGPVDNPNIHWKAQFLAVARKGLEAMGRKEAEKHIQRIDGELEELKGEVEGKVKEEVENITKSTLESAASGDTEKMEEQIEKSKESVEKLKDFNPFGED